MDNYFKNKPIQNWYSGIFTGLFYACFFAALSLGVYLSDNYGKDVYYDHRPFFYVFCIGAIAFFFLKRKFDKSTYEKIERNLDD